MFVYNDVRKDGKVKCYLCGRWVKNYKDVSKLVCTRCAKRMEKIMENFAMQYFKEKENV